MAVGRLPLTALTEKATSSQRGRAAWVRLLAGPPDKIAKKSNVSEFLLHDVDLSCFRLVVQAVCKSLSSFSPHHSIHLFPNSVCMVALATTYLPKLFPVQAYLAMAGYRKN
jgi:hypothetical protein